MFIPFAISLGPFIITGQMQGLSQIVSRLFPVQRGSRGNDREMINESGRAKRKNKIRNMIKYRMVFRFDTRLLGS